MVSAEAHDQYLTAVARTQATHSNPDVRHRVEHVIQLRDDQLAMLGELGMIASIQPGIPGDLAAEPGFPILVARGQTRWIAAGGTLWTVVFAPSAAPTCRGWCSGWVTGPPSCPTITPRCGPPGGDPEELPRPSCEDWQLTQRLMVDLVILSDDPTAIAADSLLDIQVLATMVGEQVQHCADTTLC